MTTIVATRTAMYCDSKVSVGDLSFPSEKIFRIGKELVGTAGTNQGIHKFLCWYAGKRKRPIELVKGDGFQVIVLNKRGIFTYGSCFLPDRVLRDWHAVGTGAGVATGALAAGATPRRALEIACEYAEGSGLPVQEFTL